MPDIDRQREKRLGRLAVGVYAAYLAALIILIAAMFFAATGLPYAPLIVAGLAAYVAGLAVEFFTDWESDVIW